MALPNPVPPNPGETIESAWGQSVNERVVFRYQSQLDWPSTPEVGDPWVTEQGVLLPGYSGNSGKLYVYDGTRTQEYTSWDEFGPLQDRVTSLENRMIAGGSFQGSASVDDTEVEAPVTTITGDPNAPVFVEMVGWARNDMRANGERLFFSMGVGGVKRSGNVPLVENRGSEPAFLSAPNSWFTNSQLDGSGNLALSVFLRVEASAVAQSVAYQVDYKVSYR